MKKNIILFLIIISFLNCEQNTKAINTGERISINRDTTEKNNISEILIPIKILNIKSKNAYKKYGLEFTGNCYSCDLAQLRIKNNNFIISNVCDTQSELSFKIIKFINTEKRIEIKTQSFTFIFTRIEEEPIFKLETINYDIQNKNLRISEYFTFKKDIIKFEIHDCGDFDG